MTFYYQPRSSLLYAGIRTLIPLYLAILVEVWSLVEKMQLWSYSIVYSILVSLAKVVSSVANPESLIFRKSVSVSENCLKMMTDMWHDPTWPDSESVLLSTNRVCSLTVWYSKVEQITAPLMSSKHINHCTPCGQATHVFILPPTL